MPFETTPYAVKAPFLYSIWRSTDKLIHRYPGVVSELTDCVSALQYPFRRKIRN